MYTAEQIVQAVLAAAGPDDVFKSRLERAAQDDDRMLQFLGQFLYEAGIEASGWALQRASELLVESLSQ